MNNKKTPLEELKYSWSKEYLTSEDFKDYCKLLFGSAFFFLLGFAIIFCLFVVIVR